MTNINAHAVLLLNVGYQPIGTVSIKDAVGLMMRNVVDSVDGVAAQLRTPNRVFTVPSILRLKYYVNVPHRTVTWSRHKVFARDGWTCIYCRKMVGEYRGNKKLFHSDFTIDHIIPRSHGGRSTWSNTACACYRCNHRKADRTPNEAGMRLLWEPKRPRTNYLIASGDIPEEWKIYIEI